MAKWSYIHRSSSDLQAASETVLYEFRMVEYIANAKPPNVDWQANVRLESFLIHTRNLFHFLYGAGAARRGDIVAEDFTGNKRLKRTVPTDVSAELDRISKHLAHVTHARQTKQSWDLRVYSQQIERGLDEFVALAAPGSLHNDWVGVPSPAGVLVQGLTVQTLGVTNSIGF